jgi:hypothetical protein
MYTNILQSTAFGGPFITIDMIYENTSDEKKENIHEVEFCREVQNANEIQCNLPQDREVYCTYKATS